MITTHTLMVVAVGLNAVMVPVVVTILVLVILHLRDHREPKPRALPAPQLGRLLPDAITTPGPITLDPTPTTAMAIQPPVPTDTSVIAPTNPDLGIDVVKLNRRPRPIKATDLVDRYHRQHPQEN